MAGSSNLKNPLFKPIIFSLVLCLLIQSGITTTKKTKDSLVVDADSNVQQRISILVGKAGEDTGTDIEGLPSDDGSSNEPLSTSTNLEGCMNGNGKCCFQYTWQGYLEPIDVPAPENTTCEWLKKQNKDTSSACFDPIIFTSKVSESVGATGNPPDIRALSEISEKENWNVYCPLTRGKTCMSYRFYSRGGKKEVVNETRFCGSAIETNSGNRLTSGCFTEKVDGYVKEVCICTGSLCNSAPEVIASSSVFVMLLFSWFVWCINQGH